MKSLNVILIIVAILLSAILLRLGTAFDGLRQSQKELIAANQGQKELIAANQSLEKAVMNFSKQIDPIVKRFGR
jgi:type II secretory pathway pseudopilin PulG